MITSSIITIGDELLIGQVIDTNSAWMAKALNGVGIWLKRRVAVGDNREDIVNALDEESKTANIILITGGLGPTADDITKPLLCEYFGGKLVVDTMALENVKSIFARLNRPIIERNIRQAEVPDNCTVIQNKRGTAPGMWFEKEGRIYVSMPGVPHEMKGMMEDYVLPKLKQHFRLPFISSKTLLTAGIGESFLAEMISDIEQSLPSHIRLAYLPNYGMVKLRLTATGNHKEELENEIEPLFKELQENVKEWLVADEDEGLEIVVGKILRAKNKTMGTAESCTGGYIAHLITSIAGASDYYKGSVVSYANSIKENMLNVSSDTLKQFGAVSEQTVIEMAKGAIETLEVDYVVATSGIMGPDGGSAEKPVGTVWIAAANKEKIETIQLHLRFDRERNILLTAHNALNFLRKFILSV